MTSPGRIDLAELDLIAAEFARATCAPHRVVQAMEALPELLARLRRAEPVAEAYYQMRTDWNHGGDHEVLTCTLLDAAKAYAASRDEKAPIERVTAPELRQRLRERADQLESANARIKALEARLDARAVEASR